MKIPINDDGIISYLFLELKIA